MRVPHATPHRGVASEYLANRGPHRHSSRRGGGDLKAPREEHPPEPERGGQRAERVLQGWWKDPDFLDSNGEPLKLPLRGPRRSFAALVKRYAGDPRVRDAL